MDWNSGAKAPTSSSSYKLWKDYCSWSLVTRAWSVKNLQRIRPKTNLSVALINSFTMPSKQEVNIYDSGWPLLSVPWRQAMSKAAFAKLEIAWNHCYICKDAQEPRNTKPLHKLQRKMKKESRITSKTWAYTDFTVWTDLYKSRDTFERINLYTNQIFKAVKSSQTN